MNGGPKKTAWRSKTIHAPLPLKIISWNNFVQNAANPWRCITQWKSKVDVISKGLTTLLKSTVATGYKVRSNISREGVKRPDRSESAREPQRIWQQADPYSQYPQPRHKRKILIRIMHVKGPQAKTEKRLSPKAETGFESLPFKLAGPVKNHRVLMETLLSITTKRLN